MAEAQVVAGANLSAQQREALLNSVSVTFGAICGESPEFSGESPECPVSSNVLGIIAVVGDLSWSVTLGFPQETAESLACKFAGFEIPFDSPDMADVVGELANVLAGDLVAQLDRAGVAVKMSLPTVARGNEMNVIPPGAVRSTRYRFRLPQGEMWLGLQVGQPKK